MMSEVSPIWGTKEEALANARRLLSYDLPSAENQARQVIAGDPRCAEAHRILGLALRRLGRAEEAKRAEENAISLAMFHPQLFEATRALIEQNLSKAERLLRAYLKTQPDDASALRMLAEVAGRTGHFDAAERLINQALATAPDFAAAKSLMAAIDRVRERERSGGLNTGRSSVALEEELGAEEVYRESLKLYEQVVREFPDKFENWLSYGYVLRIIGRQDEALGKFRRALEAKPASGEAWWAIADLKASRFTKDDAATLKQLVQKTDLPSQDLAQLNFALARALEQFADYDGAFAHYAEGNRLRALTSNHDPDAVTRHVDRSVELFDAEFFRRRVDAGDTAPDPIFVLGMPRAGSTLIEQILSSHPEIEGVSELPDLPGIAKWLGDGKEVGFEDSTYLDKLAALPADELQRLGRGYIWNSGLRRRTMKPRFVDKMPNNWLHLGLILAIVPNAKIIDARRHPLACILSNYRQHFAKGQDFSYDLNHMARFYADYVRMMAHFDKLMPGRVHRVIHENLIAEPEIEVRELLDHLGLEFDEHCLRFYENKRPVATASSEQVRRPLYRDALDEWRHFEHWLEPVKDALGSIADCYPAVPATIGR